MSLILFFIGIAVLGYGRVSFSSIEAEGPQVRAAGFMLMMPLIAQLVMGTMADTLFVADGESRSGVLTTFLTILDISVMVICVGVAYTLVNGEMPNNIIRMPKSDQKDAKENTASTSSTATTEQKPRQEARPASPPPPKPQPKKPQRQSGNFPTVMSTKEAARYLNISEADVMSLINDGKISAARINYRYRISRDVLDDYLDDQQGTTE